MNTWNIIDGILQLPSAKPLSQFLNRSVVVRNIAVSLIIIVAMIGFHILFLANQNSFLVLHYQ